ncbi:hypothetical protein [Mesorhizobium helmanticense]|uniref:hypothetical protein n=1 Tax=Mesorhizobium helmanticense TaxID=1776423 RepID=UPI0011B20EAC|nr:hypothetical protein [Mesorhizobium helmanticense]
MNVLPEYYLVKLEPIQVNGATTNFRPYAYASIERIFDKVHAFAMTPETGLLVANRRKKSEKTAQNGAKTGYFGQVEPNCYIMATMGPKHSVYVKINAAECLFLRQEGQRMTPKNGIGFWKGPCVKSSPTASFARPNGRAVL